MLNVCYVNWFVIFFMGWCVGRLVWRKSKGFLVVLWILVLSYLLFLWCVCVLRCSEWLIWLRVSRYMNWLRCFVSRLCCGWRCCLMCCGLILIVLMFGW